MQTGEKGILLIKHFESLHDGDLSKIGLQPKMCPAGIWTVGYGHALKDINGSWLKGVDGFSRLMDIYPDYETITEEEANDLLKVDLQQMERSIDSLHLELNQDQFDSLVSFAFNCGFGALYESTLLKRIKSKSGNIHEAFLMWVKSNGKTLQGLVNRREVESLLYTKGILKFNN